MPRSNVKSRKDNRAQAKMPRGASYDAKSGMRQLADMDDGILDSDSEEDEFANDAGPSKPRAVYGDSGDGDGDEEEVEEPDEDEEEEGVGAWAPDDWDDEASDVGSDDSGSSSGDAAESGSEDDDGAYGRDSLVSLIVDPSRTEANLAAAIAERYFNAGPHLIFGTLTPSDLNALPLASVLKAQKALKKANRRQDDDDDDGSEGEDVLARAGPSQSKAQKVAEMKARLADLQRSKGRNVTIAAASYGEAAEPSDDDEGDDSAPETSGTGQERGGRTVPRGQAALKRDSKHACVVNTRDCAGHRADHLQTNCLELEKASLPESSGCRGQESGKSFPRSAATAWLCAER